MKLTKENCKQTGGLDLIEFYWICLELAWQSGVSFDSGILISWDKEKKSKWVQPMPTRDDLHGFDCINFDNRATANPVELSSLKPEAQEYHKQHGNVFQTTEDKLFKGGNPDQVVDAVANFGRGPVLMNFKPGCHEKEEQDDFSYWMAQTTWLIS